MKKYLSRPIKDSNLKFLKDYLLALLLSSKRMAIKDHFLLSIKKVLEKVREAEEETACKKKTKVTKATENVTEASQCSRKHKHQKHLQKMKKSPSMTVLAIATAMLVVVL
ncbi:hypothetical protein GP486_003239 [Trichoglossum hirsutum]|uniref:Uncharacterized protein n=1 Tax=Trichoglossum hirsutum TaxID=265104 RepID=A0A9P8LDM5_9PEZI|nr:hypothetical protein GP486_003239 [Trichoglossum hirsutum]